MSPEKGAVDAVEIARRSGRRLRVAAKEPTIPLERDYFENVFRPAARTADVEFLGELGPVDRDRLFAESYASLMPGDWPEPFGLVAIESLACGTPVVARRVGGIPEIVRDGIDGVVDDSVAALAGRLDEVGRPRPDGDPGLGPRALLGRPDGRRLRGGLRPGPAGWPRRAPVGIPIADGGRVRPGS